MKSSPRWAECDRLRPPPSLCEERATDPRCPLVVEMLNLRATISSRTDLKSSRKTVSDAHLKTRANLQYGLMPLLAEIFAALITMSVDRKTIENAMQSNMIPKRVLIRTSAHRLYPYVFLIAATSFQVVKIHHGSRSSASHGRVRTLTSEPSELKYEKLDQASAIQKGWTQRSEMMKTREPHKGRNGRIFNHETTLWRKYDMKRRVAVVDRYQP
jgi:hypothetical protein